MKSTDTFSEDAQDFVRHLDAASLTHMAWSQRVLRCAVLRTLPGDDVLAPDAHNRCRFGSWFGQQRARFDTINAAAAQELEEQHQRMHDAGRLLCQSILEGAAGEPALLDTFEDAQTKVIDLLAHLKTEYLARSARIDALTGLPLRYGLEEEFQRCHSQAVRRGEQMVVVLLDLDHFKRVNDEHGHAAGDLALQHVASLLRGRCRAGEPLFRFGGEEFVVLLQATGLGAAQQAAERLLQALRDTPLKLPDGNPLALRASAGLAAAGPQESMADVLGRADQALYAAKAAGRDTWRCAETSAPHPPLAP